MASLDTERLGLVFATRPDIVESIQKAAGTLTPWILVVQLVPKNLLNRLR